MDSRYVMPCLITSFFYQEWVSTHGQEMKYTQLKQERMHTKYNQDLRN